MSDSHSENLVNQITLNYLLNKEQYDRHVHNKISKSVNKKDKKFYRKRIFSLTKDLLYGLENQLSLLPDIKYAFDNYVKTCITCFKSIDTSDILQEEYKEIDLNQEIPNNLGEDDENFILSKEEADKLMMRSVKLNVKTLDGFVKRVNSKKEETMVLPQQKEINLKDPNLKTKGITNNSIKKKKNINNIYGTKNTEKTYENKNNENKEK